MRAEFGLGERIARAMTACAAVALLGLGLTAMSAEKAEARTSLSIGVGIGGPIYGGAPYYYGHRPSWRRPYWGPRPYWYGASWYRPYSYWGPSFNYYASFPMYRSWPERSRIYHRDAYSAALSGPIGESYGWDDGVDHGAVTAVRDGQSGDKYCREFLQEVEIAGRMERVYGAACQEPDGSWRIVPHND